MSGMLKFLTILTYKLLLNILKLSCCKYPQRKLLYSQIVLSGGSTLFKGFGERLLLEVRKHRLAPRDTKIRIAAPPERLYTTWIG